MSERILVVDDEKAIADLIEVYLQNANYTVFKCYTAEDALRCIESQELDLAILDIMLPGTDGFTICKKIRESHFYPVIMLTAKNSETDKVNGLSLGADDYITKPFRSMELIARVKAQLRRYNTYSKSSSLDQEDSVLEYKHLKLDVIKHECLLCDEPIALTPTEFTILHILMKNIGYVVSTDTLFKETWGETYYTKNTNSITVHIRHIREKLHDTGPSPSYIKSVWGVGYKI